jgi:hypothetical protein
MITLDKTVQEMRSLGELLADYSYPSVSSEEEDDISPLKTREVVVDGYELILHYSKQRYEDSRTIECLQILSKHGAFLPFFLVSKLAKKFLGDRFLNFIDVYINGKKVYCWTLNRDRFGEKVQYEYDAQEIEFEGLKFGYLNPSTVNFL